MISNSKLFGKAMYDLRLFPRPLLDHALSFLGTRDLRSVEAVSRALRQACVEAAVGWRTALIHEGDGAELTCGWIVSCLRHRLEPAALPLRRARLRLDAADAMMVDVLVRLPKLADLGLDCSLVPLHRLSRLTALVGRLRGPVVRLALRLPQKSYNTWTGKLQGMAPPVAELRGLGDCLQRLELCGGICGEETIASLAQLPQLTSLTLAHATLLVPTATTFFEPLAVALKQLVELRLDGLTAHGGAMASRPLAHRLTSADYLAFLETMPQLTSLSVAASSADDDLGPRLAAWLPRLETLEVPATRVSSAFVCAVAGLPLRVLNIRFATNLCEVATIDALAHLARLRRLIVQAEHPLLSAFRIALPNVTIVTEDPSQGSF